MDGTIFNYHNYSCLIHVLSAISSMSSSKYVAPLTPIM